MIKKNKR